MARDLLLGRTGKNWGRAPEASTVAGVVSSTYARLGRRGKFFTWVALGAAALWAAGKLKTSVTLGGQRWT